MLKILVLYKKNCIMFLKKLYWIEISLKQGKLVITLLDKCEASEAFLSSVFWNIFYEGRTYLFGDTFHFVKLF